jgi:hypothetical protein
MQIFMPRLVWDIDETFNGTVATCGRGWAWVQGPTSMAGRLPPPSPLRGRDLTAIVDATSRRRYWGLS